MVVRAERGVRVVALRSARALASREDWLKHRKIGASDIAKVLGVSPYGSAWDVYARLVKPPTERPPQTADMARGHRWEPIILDLYEAETGRRVLRPKANTLWEGPEAWASATPDGFVVDKDGTWGLIEAKTDRNPEKWGDPCTIDGWEPGAERIVRSDYALQCYAQMHVIDRPFVDLTVLLPSYEMKVFRIVRDLEVENAIVEAVGAWYTRHVVGGEEPNIDGSDACRDWFARKFPAAPSKRPARLATEAEVAIAGELAETKAALEHLKGEEKRLSALLMQSMAGERALDLGGDRKAVLIHAERSGGLDTKALFAARPDLKPVFEQYQKPGSSSAYIRLFGGKE